MGIYYKSHFYTFITVFPFDAKFEVAKVKCCSMNALSQMLEFVVAADSRV